MKVVVAKSPLHETGLINKLVRDYLREDAFFGDLQCHLPVRSNTGDWINARANFPFERRSLLKKTLESQYQRIGLYSDAIAAQIQLIELPNTFTVCTGQQVGILLGPFYTTLKILSAISLCAELKKQHPDKNFIPLFWMASEDHDIEEIRAVYFGGNRYAWNTDQTGPAGRLKPSGISELVEAIPELKHHADGLDLLKKAYALPTLADATQYLCSELFGSMGLLALDPDEPELKASFASIALNDIVEQNSFRESRKAIAHLEQRYKIQLNGRPVNFFYQTDTSRERIEPSEIGFSTEHGTFHWSQAELQQELHQNPTAFSPNAMMRPLYQEFILPNLAYFGGAAELSYWLELKPVFDFYNVPFPAVLLRNSAFVLDAVNLHRCRNAGFAPLDLIRPLLELEKELVLRENPNELDLSEERAFLEKIKQTLLAKASYLGSGMPQAAEAFSARMLKEVDALQGKMLREARRNESDGLRQLRLAREVVFPGGSFQERKECLFGFLAQTPNQPFLAALSSMQQPFGNALVEIQID
jgi:bacillithiol biosynthesis cysteine-adding enzyme BshC